MQEQQAVNQVLDVAVPNVTWEAVQRALARDNHPPVIVFAHRSGYGRGTAQSLRAAARKLMPENPSGSQLIVMSSVDPKILEVNHGAIKACHLEQASVIALVFKNGGAPDPYPCPTG